MSEQPTESLIEYPCEIPVKVMGKTEDGNFEEEILEIFTKHCGEITEEQCSTRKSKEGNFIALTVKVMAKSKAQMDDLYQDITNHKLVIMAL